ncbi:hypothetical protein [Pseudoruegeria sp. HB172150]|uniref:hypothetical protein n=1 Tax=Pseudoruegeria sp. HB172150 TaxID=2721164 RepID=UPI00155207D8|nr:hypothetical protein [Pseudoruegeria sp. HB172150]
MEASLRSVLYAILAVACLCAATLPAQAQRRCGLTPELDALVAELKLQSFNGPEFVASRSGRLRGLVDSTVKTGVADRLRAIGFENLGVAVFRLMNEAANISDARRIPDAGVLRARIQSVEQLRDQACSTPRSTDVETPSLRDLSNDRHSTPWATPSRLLWLWGLAGAITIALYTVRWSYRWGYALVHKRMACLIAAHLQIGDVIIHGDITTLGRRGCKFRPQEDIGLKTIRELAETADATVLVGPNRYPSYIHGIYDDFGSFFFLEAISPAVQHRLLTRSRTAPYYVKKDTRKPNVRRRRTAASA